MKVTIQYHCILRILAGLALSLTLACKSENFGKNPSSDTSESNSQQPKPQVAEEAAPVIPRLEFPGDKSNFGNFEVGEEASIATDVTGAYLSVPKGVLSAGAAIAIRTTQKVLDSAIKTLKIVIPKKNSASDDNLVVLYRMTSETGVSYYGLIPKKDVAVDEESVSFQPMGLGVYEAAVLPTFIDEARQVPVLRAQNGPKLSQISSYDTPGLANDVYLYKGTTAFVADGTGVELLNWSVATGLSANSRLTGPGTINAITGILDRVYVAAGTSGLGMIDLTKALSLQVSDCKGSTNSLAISENGKNLYLAQEKTTDGQTLAGVSRFDIQQAAPRYEKTEILGDAQAKLNAYSVQIQGTVAYALNALGLYSVDITQNDRFNPLGFLSTDGSAQKFIIYSNRIYVAEKNTGIIAIDPLNPSSLKSLARLSLPQVVDVAGKGKYLIAVDAYRKVSLIDISDPSHPLILNQINVNGMPTKVRVFGETIFVTMGDTGIAALVIDEVASP